MRGCVGARRIRWADLRIEIPRKRNSERKNIMSELTMYDITRVEITPDGIGDTLWTTINFYHGDKCINKVTCFHKDVEKLQIITNPSKYEQAA